MTEKNYGDQVFDIAARERWEEVAKASLKGLSLEKVLNSSTVEGVNYRGLYDKNDLALEHFSFPETFTASTVYDSGSADISDIEQDLLEGADSCVLVVKGNLRGKKIPERLNVTYLIQAVDDDSLAEFSKKKNAYVDVNKLDFSRFDEEIERVKSLDLEFGINISQVHNAGASVAQETSFGLNMFSRLIERSVEPEKMVFFTATDSLFFMNIAKLRALRFLAEELLLAAEKPPKVTILSFSSLREQTLYDPWVNMLRNCSSSMASVLGGADQVVIRPRDAAFSLLTAEPSSKEARRAARNTLSVIREEAKLDFVKDAGKGSFAIEELSKEICAQSWESFLNWKEKGFLENMKDFSKSVEAIAKARFEKIQKRKKRITGINDFANPEETLGDLYQKPWMPVDLASGLFPLRRTAFEFEQLRIALEKSGAQFKATLVFKGSLSALSARINFVKNVFETLGVKIEEVEAGEDLSRTFETARSDGSNILIFVGKDEEYASWLVPGDPETFKSQFVAGNKENFELKQADAFRDIFIGKNIFEELKLMLEKEGVSL